MATCWTCGSRVESYSYSCSRCEPMLAELRSLRKGAESASRDAVESLSRLARLQKEGLDALSDTFSAGLSEIACAIEWGFQEISWQLQQQTAVLQSIDHTLKTPGETQANEWRKVAEELRRRGVLGDSEQFYLRALQANPLDYRTYIGLAETYLQSNEFDQAKDFLERSLPHAPKEEQRLAAWCTDCRRWVWVTSSACAQCHRSGLSQCYYHSGFDWKSYSYRLIGRIYACQEEYSRAAATLRSSIELSPEYEDGHYDYAQYCAQTRNMEACVSSLEKAILEKPLYWYLARKERNFDPFRTQIETSLSKISTEASGEATQAITESESVLMKAKQAVSRARAALMMSGTRAHLESATKYDDAETRLEAAKDKAGSGDYTAFLEALPLAEDVYDIASEVLKVAEDERKQYGKSFQVQIEEAKRDVKKIRGWFTYRPLLVGLASCIWGFMIGGLGGCSRSLFGGTGDWGVTGAAIGGLVGFLIGLITTIVVLLVWYSEAQRKLRKIRGRSVSNSM